MLKNRIKEKGAIIKKGHKGVSIALGFPDTYYLGMSNLGFQSIYSMFNDDARVACERFFIDKDGMTPLRTMENRRTLNEFDAIAFSLSYELNAVNVLKALNVSRIKLKRRDRSRLDPLIMVGGPCATINPLPLFPFIDVFCCGDGEELVPLVSDVLSLSRSKEDALEMFNELEGFVVPEYFEKAPCAKSPALVKKENFKPLISQILSNQTEFANTCLVEIMRGCPYGCRFCLIGYAQLPWKHHTVDAILEALQSRMNAAEESKYVQRKTAGSSKTKSYSKRILPKLGLIAPSSTDHPHFVELVNALNQQGYKSISFSSLKFNELNHDYLDIIKRNKIKSITIAPETGSDQLRKAMNKNISNRELVTVCAALASHRIKMIKLYFILGIPAETNEDLLSTIDFIHQISDAISPYKSILSLSFNYLVPKPMTPFQYAPINEPDMLKEKAAMIVQHIKKIKKIQFSFMKPETAYFQALLALGDTDISSMLEEMTTNESARKKILLRFIDNHKTLLFSADKKCREAVNRVIKSRFPDNYLLNEYHKSLIKVLTPPCPAAHCIQCPLCS